MLVTIGDLNAAKEVERLEAFIIDTKTTFLNSPLASQDLAVADFPHSGKARLADKSLRR